MATHNTREVAVVSVSNALIQQSFVASKNVAIGENGDPSNNTSTKKNNNNKLNINETKTNKQKNKNLNGHSNSGDDNKRRSSFLKRRSTSRGVDPVNKSLRLVLEALVHKLRPTEKCRLLTSLTTSTPVRKKGKQTMRMELHRQGLRR